MFLWYMIVWVLAGLFNWGLVIGGFTHSHPEFKPPMFFAVMTTILGPWGVLGALIGASMTTGIHFRMNPLTKEEAWEAFQKKYPHLTREFFETNY